MVNINGTDFDLFNYQRTENGVRLTVNGATTAELEEAIGDAADIAISDEYRGYGLKLANMFKQYGNPVRHEIELMSPDIEEIVQQNATNLEIQAGAIAELADMIGGML